MLNLVEVRVVLKAGVADPEGSNVSKTLGQLGIQNSGVAVEKVYLLKLEAGSEAAALAQAERAAAKLLANPVIQDAKISLRRP